MQIEVNEGENGTRFDAEVDQNGTGIMEIADALSNEELLNATTVSEDLEDKGNATISSKLKNEGAYKIYSNCLTDTVYGSVEVSITICQICKLWAVSTFWNILKISDF